MEPTLHEQVEANKQPPIFASQGAYYEMFFRRQSVFKEALLALFFNICSWPRLVLEVFLRRNMGERYFSFTAVILIFSIILFLTFQFIWLCSLLGVTKKVSYMCSGLILFDVVFLWFGYQRNEEIKRLPSVYDFKRFSLSTGTTDPRFNKFTTDRRTLTIWYEPAVCFAAGFGCLFLLQLPLAFLLMSCSIIYSLSYVAAYHQGDNFLMDHIDQRICKEDLAKTFENNIPYDETRGAEYFGHQPKDPHMRQRMASAFKDQPAHRMN